MATPDARRPRHRAGGVATSRADQFFAPSTVVVKTFLLFLSNW